MIENDGYDSAMLQRFLVLRRAKDEGWDVQRQSCLVDKGKLKSMLDSNNSDATTIVGSGVKIILEKGKPLNNNFHLALDESSSVINPFTSRKEKASRNIYDGTWTH